MTAPLMLTVSGLRGLVGQSLTPPVAARYAAAFGQWLKSKRRAEERAPHVVLGRDSRPSGQMIEMAAASGLVGVGCKVTCLGIVTTPAVAIMAEHFKADGGMVITASHNPIVWNGIKALRHDGVAPPPSEARDIIDRFQSDQVEYAPVEALIPLEYDNSTHRVHVDRVLTHVDVPLIRKRKLKAVVDSVHGAGGPSAALLLQELGVELVHLFAEPTGRFPHPPEPTGEHLKGLCEAVKQHHADVGFAQDPDADRLAIVDDRGRYIGEEYTLVLAALNVLNRPNCPKPPVVVANLSTSRMLNDITTRFKGRVVRTPVGEANVAAAVRQHAAVIGGEGNGGVIWPPVVHVRDSLSGMALVAELLAREGRPLSAIVDEIPAYAIVKEKTDILPGTAGRHIDALRKHFSSQAIDLQDGLRVDWPDRWIHVRPSNTEPIVRIIAEARDQHTAEGLIAEVFRTLDLRR